MKKFLFTLFVGAAIFAGCQKDTGTNVTISPNDLVTINGQLKGSWVFPVESINYVDNSGKTILPGQNMTSPAFQFDGNAKVNIMPDLRTVQAGTYALTTDQGLIYLNIVYPDNTKVKYQVLLMNNEMLKLVSTQPFTYYDINGAPVNITAVTNTVLHKQNSADATGDLVRVMAMSDSVYNINVNVAHKGDTATLVNSKVNATGQYSYAFAAKHGDHIMVDMVGSPSSSAFYVFYNGLPLTGNIVSQSNEITTGAGWNVP